MSGKRDEHVSVKSRLSENYVLQLYRLVASLLFSPKFNLAQKRGFINMLRNYSPLTLRKRSLSRSKHGFAPEGFTVSVTDRCNLHCKYCYADSGPKGHTDVDRAKLNIIIDEMLAQFGIRFIAVTGGEPIPRVLELAGSRPDITFDCYTNATHLTRDICRELRRLGNVFLSVSIIGDTDTHDSIRGKGNYETVMAGIQNLKEQSLIWGFSLTESRANYDLLTRQDLLSSLEQHDPYFIRGIPFTPVGRESGQACFLVDEERHHVGRVIRDHKRRGRTIYYDYINDPSLGISCIAGGSRGFFINEKLQLSPCVFMDSFVKIEFDSERNWSNVFEILLHHPFMINARKYGRTYPRCILLNDTNWRERIEGCSTTMSTSGSTAAP